MPNLTVRDLYTARQRIAPLVRRTPLVASDYLSQHTNGIVYLKLECQQETGSFKLRGAANKIFSLSAKERERGVITVSTGNHGRAVAYVAQKVGVPATICVSTATPQNKLDAMRRLGAELFVEGATYADAEALAHRLMDERGLTMIAPFDDPLIIAGQGTIGLEILEELPQIDTVIVPLSGGGLLAGIALALKSADPGIRVIGVSQERGPGMWESLRAGRPVAIVEEPTLADSLAGGIGLDNRYTFPLVQSYVDDVVLVSEAEIAAAMTFALSKHHLIVEGGGAVGIAALLADKGSRLGQNTAVIVSGGNVDIPVLLKIAENHAK